MADIDLTSSTVNLVKLKAKLDAGGVNQGDLVAAIYDLALAIYAICNNLDTDAATLGTDYMAKIGTPLIAAAQGLVNKPAGDTTAA